MFPLWVNIVLLLLSLLLLSILIFLVKEKVFLSLLSSHYSTAQYPFQVWMGLWWNQWLYWFGFGERYSLSYLRSYFASSPEMICFIDSLQLEKGEKEKEKEISLGDKIMRTTLRKLWLAEPPMNHFGKIYFQDVALSMLKVRCQLRKITEKIKTSPKWSKFFSDDTFFSKSVIVCGLPRTGSSVLNHLLSQDRKMWTPDRSLMFSSDSLMKEFLEKFDSVEKDDSPKREEEENKAEEEENAPEKEKSVDDLPEMFQMLFKMNPKLLSAYPWFLGGQMEDINLLERLGVQYFLQFLASTSFHDFSSEEWEAIYKDFRYTVHIALWFQKRRKEYLCFKAQSHVCGLAEMMKVFPQTNVIMLHRNPLECISSITSMYTMAASTVYSTAHHPTLLEAQIKRIESNTKSALKFSKPNPRIIHVRFQDIVADPIETVRRIYEKFQIPFSEEFHNAMQTWLKNNPRGKYGKHTYARVTLEDAKEKFGEYARTFDLELE